MRLPLCSAKGRRQSWFLRRAAIFSVAPPCTYIVMYATLFLHHAAAHVESMEKHARHPQRYLREVKHDAGLVDKVDTLGPAQPLLLG